MSTPTRARLFLGLTALVIGVGFNPWLATRLFSADGQIELASRVLIFAFDGFMIVVGLLGLFASRALINGLIISAVAGLVSIVLVDLAARSLLRGVLYYQPESMFKDREPDMPTHWRFEPNVDYHGSTFGDLAAMKVGDSLRDFREVTFRTDDYGFRNDPVDTTRPLDLIILGDSFGAGSGTSQENTWDAIFRTRYGLNTYNLSMPGNTPWHELIVLKQELPRLKVGPGTTILWAIFGANDLDEPRPPFLDPPAPAGIWMRSWVRLVTFFHRSPLKQFGERVWMATLNEPLEDTAIVSTLPDGRPMLFFSPYLKHERRSIEELRWHRNLPKLKSELAEMGRFTRANGLQLLVVSLPSKCWVYSWVVDGRDGWSEDSEPTAFARALAELCRLDSLPFIDLGAPMRDEARRSFLESDELLWWRDDTHWNGRGQSVAAMIVHDHLKTPSE